MCTWCNKISTHRMHLVALSTVYVRWDAGTVQELRFTLITQGNPVIIAVLSGMSGLLGWAIEVRV